jgi:ornithine decarboxylase
MILSLSGAAASLFASSIDRPVIGLRPDILEARVRDTLERFPGDVLYAVKCNAHPAVIRGLWDAGVRHFDTASIAEIRLIKSMLPQAACYFMHPVKSRRAIEEAYHHHGVRRFVVDHLSEFDKIVEILGDVDDLELIVRLAVPGEGAVLSLTGKFGADMDEAAVLLRRCRSIAVKSGITFHVGSQSLAPHAFAHAVRMAADVARRAGGIDMLDVGGGFPARYLGTEPLFDEFVEVIEAAVAETGLECALQCEPGRLLVADAISIFTRIEMRRGRSLFVNDGVYGNLAETKWVGPQFPMRLIREDEDPRAGGHEFDLFGPTCDSIDSMPGPHYLPADAAEGDWIEVAMMGAYSCALGTDFNGFGHSHLIEYIDEPWYETTSIDDEKVRRFA